MQADHVYVDSAEPNLAMPTACSSSIRCHRRWSSGRRRSTCFSARWPMRTGRAPSRWCCRAPARTVRAALKRIKEYGGLAIVQDPDEAEYGDMPRNSIATGLVDYVLPVAEMPQRILEYPRAHARCDQVGDVCRRRRVA